MDREAWRAAVHGVAKGQTRLSGRAELMAPALAPLWFVPDSLGHSQDRRDRFHTPELDQDTQTSHETPTGQRG